MAAGAASGFLFKSTGTYHIPLDLLLSPTDVTLYLRSWNQASIRRSIHDDGRSSLMDLREATVLVAPTASAPFVHSIIHLSSYNDQLWTIVPQ